MLIECPNIFHWKSAKKTKWVCSYEKNLAQIWSNIAKSTKKLALLLDFFIFCKRNTFKGKKRWLQEYMSGNLNVTSATKR